MNMNGYGCKAVFIICRSREGDRRGGERGGERRGVQCSAVNEWDDGRELIQLERGMI